jgi:PBSX family phage terminase large subunit
MVNVKALDPFKCLYRLPEGTNTVICIGGRGGAKTYEVAKFIAFCATIKKKRVVVLRDEKELIRESILNEVLMRYDTANATGALSAFYQRLDTGIKDIQTNEMLVFTKGFRASTTDKRANLKSISNIDMAVIEEAEDIRDQDKFNIFSDGIRKEGALIVIVLNTPDISHWITKRYFTLERVEDGYYDVIPKQIPGLVVIKTGYADNPHLPATVVERYKAYGDPASPFYNRHYYLTAIRGLASTGRKGQIFHNWKSITNKEFNEIEARSIFGQDFGTSSPAPTGEIKIVNNRMYIRGHNYQPMTEKQIGMLYCRLGIKEEVIIADSAEPLAIRRLRAGWRLDELSDEERADYAAWQAEALKPATMTPHGAPGTAVKPWKYARLLTGFHIFPAFKGPGTIAAGIKKVMDYEVFVTEDSADIWFEYANYVYATDKNGEPTDEPEDAWNHYMDLIRYVCTGKGRYY